MKSAIEKIYSGSTDSQNFEMTEEWKRLKDKWSEVFDKFYASLNKKQKRQYEKLFQYESGQQHEELLQCYQEGFKLGLQLGVEVFQLKRGDFC